MESYIDTVTITLHEYNRLRIINEQVLKGNIVILTSLSLMPGEYSYHYSNHKQAFTTDEALKLQSDEIARLKQENEKLSREQIDKNLEHRKLQAEYNKLERQIIQANANTIPATEKEKKDSPDIKEAISIITRANLASIVDEINIFNIKEKKKHLLSILSQK